MTSAATPPPPPAPLLHELDRDALSVFLYVSFVGEELAELIKGMGLHFPGYRLESLPDEARADALADELRAHPQLAAHVTRLLAELYEFPALEGVPLSPDVAGELGALAVEEDAMVRLLWRLLADPSPDIRAAARAPLQALVQAYYGPPPGTPEGEVGEVVKAIKGMMADKRAPQSDARLLKRAERAEAEAERTKKKNDELKAQLKEVRAELAAFQREAGAQRKTAERLSAQVEKSRGQAEKKTRVSELRAELERARRQVEGLSAHAAALEEREQQLAEAPERLQAELRGLRRELEQARAQAPAEAGPEAEPGEPAEPPASWVLPRYTREFYDSLDGWDPRIQRAAFKQAALLAENHRHPSLRAIPLEGLPDYFRVRVATDVRLIYRRRGERELEILSLIDREDLDRYVRQAKTR